MIRRGDLIRLRAFGEKRIVRRFIAKQNGRVLICSDAEYKLAIRERRGPICVGFPVEDVIGVMARGLVNLRKERSSNGPRKNRGQGR